MRRYRDEWKKAMNGAEVLLRGDISSIGASSSMIQRSLQPEEVLTLNARRHLPRICNVSNAMLCLSLRGLKLELERQGGDTALKKANRGTRDNSDTLANIYYTLGAAEKSLMALKLTVCNEDVARRLHSRGLLKYFGSSSSSSSSSLSLSLCVCASLPTPFVHVCMYLGIRY